MEVLWLSKAIESLENELDYIGKENPDAAAFLTKRILERVALLEKSPGLGRPGRLLGTRELMITKTNYIIPYRVKKNRIEILRVFHTSKKPPKSW